MRKLTLLISVIVMSLVIAACGGATDEAGDSGDGATAQTVSLPLEASTVDDEGNTVSLNYPEGWIKQEAGGQIIVATDQEIIDGGGDNVQAEPGQALAAISAIPPSAVGLFLPDTEPSATAILEVFIQFTAGGEDAPEFGDMTEFTIDGKSAVRTIATNQEGGDFILMSVELDGSYAVILGGVAKDEVDAQLPTFEAIAGSISIETASSDG